VQIFLHEFVTGGGMWRWGDERPAGSLLNEGRAMASALAADFAAIPDLDLVVARDVRLDRFAPPDCREVLVSGADGHDASIRELAAAADWTMIIAPEIENELFRATTLARSAGGRVLGPGSQSIQMASDKQATSEYLRRHGIPVPRGTRLGAGKMPPENLRFPLVWKPIYGAGSMGIEWVNEPSEFISKEVDGWIEEFQRGIHCSCAALVGPSGIVPLPPCRQDIDFERGFAYRGGSLPLEANLATRARMLAEAALTTLPDPLGYMGVDMVLGDDPAGRDDVVIEINPRLTTSYVGLRAACCGNLAQAMLAIAQGKPFEMEFLSEPLSFSADGEVIRGVVA
jgi:predicted ATP-grasp superfamily ATP-dependent carboligase